MTGSSASRRAWSSFRAMAGPRRQHPPATVALDRSVHAWVLRVALALLATACGLLVIPSSGYWMVAVPIIAASAAWPGGLAPTGIVVGTGLLHLTTAADPFGWELFALVFGVHLTVEVAALIGGVPPTAVVELRVLTDAGGRFVAVQAVSQALVFVGAWAAGGQPTDVFVPVAAGAALGVTAWLLLARLRALR